MLWRWLWSFSRGVRTAGGGGGGGTAVGLPCPRPVAPIRPREGDSTHSDGRWHGRYRQYKTYGCGKLSHFYCPLDAFTWGALAVLAVELAKQVRWSCYLQPDGGNGGICHLEGQLSVLPQHQHAASTLLTDPSPSSDVETEQIFNKVHSGYAQKNPSSSKSSQQKEHKLLLETEDLLFPLSTVPEPDSHISNVQGNLEEEVSLNEAVSQVQQVFQANISVASNILGLKNMQEGQHKMAFSCFKLAADRNYSKAQFNVGMCYEHGRGTAKNMSKALFYYQQAARQGHAMAQYHYAKWLLRHWPKVDSSDGSLEEAMGLLDQAATAGLTQAQAYLGMLRLKGVEPERLQKYLPMAAKSGHDTCTTDPVLRVTFWSSAVLACKVFLSPRAVLMKLLPSIKDSSGRFHLGACYENNFETHQKSYQQPDAKCKLTKERMTVKKEEETPVPGLPQASLQARTFASSPCLQSLDQPIASHTRQPVLGLLHSWSTGCLSDLAGGALPGTPNPAFSNGLTFKLQSLAWSTGAVIG